MARSKAKKPKDKDNVVSTFKKEGTALGESIVNSSGKTTKGTVSKKMSAPKKSPPVKKVPSKKSVSVRA